MRKIKPIVGKWQIGVNFRERSWTRMQGDGWRLFRFWCLKIIKIPPPGHLIGPEDYKGFYIKFAYWLPIDNAD